MARRATWRGRCCAWRMTRTYACDFRTRAWEINLPTNRQRAAQRRIRWISTADQVGKAGLQIEGDRTKPVSLLVGVVDALGDGAAGRTLDSLKAAKLQAPTLSETGLEIVLLQPADPTTGETAALTWYLGKPYTLRRPDGNPYVSLLTSREAWLALHAGDEVEADFLNLSLELLARQLQVGYVCCWKTIHAERGDWLQTHPLPTMSELLAVDADLPQKCHVLRTQPDLPLSDVVEERLNQYGEGGCHLAFG